MKIAFIAIKGIDRIGGVETYTVELGRRLVDAGHQVIVYTAKTPEHPIPFYHQGMRVIPLTTLHHKYFEKMVLVIHASLHQFSVKGIDVVHYHAVGPSLFSFLPRLIGRYSVFQSHGHEWERSSWNGLARLFFHVSEKLTFWFANDATAVSRTLQQYYQQKYGKDVTYIPTGITPRLHPAALKQIARYGVTPGSYILYVGRLSLEKRVHDLIQAYQQLKQPRVKLVIVGSARDKDPYADELKALAGNNPNILFTGAVYGEELAEWYNNAYVYVLPSQMEGLPITLLEAMSLGCCCIASDIDANTEALDGKGILFPTSDTSALRDRLQSALDDPAHVQQIGATLYQHVLNHYTWTLVTQQFIQFYQKALPAAVNKGNVTIMKGNNSTSLPAKTAQEALNAPHLVLADPQPNRDYAAYAPPPKIPLSHYWSTLRQNAGPILLSTALITALMLGLALLTNPTYTAKSSVKIETTTPKLLEYDVDTARPPSYIDENIFYNTQYKMLRSRDLATEVIDTLGIRDSLLQERAFKAPVYWLLDPLKALAADVRKWFPGNEDAAAWDTPEVTAEEIFLQHLSINPVRNSRIIDIHYTAGNPVMARNIVQSMTDVFVNLQQRGKQANAEQAKQFLDKQIDEARDKLQISEAAMIRYARDKNIVDTDSDESIIAKNLEELSKAHMAAKEKRIQTQSLYNSKETVAGSLNVEGSALIQEHKKELGKLESTYLANLELFKPNYPAMLSLKEQINSRKRLIAEESSNIRSDTSTNLKASYDAALSEERKLDNEIKLLEKELLQFRDDSIGYANLKRDVETSRSLYDGLLQRLKEVSVVETAQTGSISIIDKAILPSRKDGPSYPKYLLLGLLSGLFLSALAVLIRETLHPKVRLVEDLQEISGKYQVLHSLPYSKAVLGSNQAELLQKQPDPSWVDALRYLKTSLVLANNGRFPQILHVTSALPGEGKSTTAVSLALMLANTGNKVLLIDADLRKPTIHKHLELDNSYGLTHYLTGTAHESPLTRVKGSRLLFVICAGPAVPDPVEALSGAYLQTLLDKSREVFDYVIIDAPPVLGMADSLLLANRADGTLLIAANNRSSKQDVRTAIDCLEKSHGKIIGLVQNMVPSKSSSKNSHYSDGRSMIVHA